MGLKRPTNDNVHKVCQLIVEGCDEKTICKKMNISERSLKNIRSGYSYRKISSQYEGVLYKKSGKRLSTQVVNRAKKLLLKGESVNTITKMLNISVGSVYKIKYELERENEASQINTNNKSEQDNIRTDSNEVNDEVVEVKNSAREDIIKDKKIHVVSRLIQDGYTDKDIEDFTDIDKRIVILIRDIKRISDITSQYNLK